MPIKYATFQKIIFGGTIVCASELFLARNQQRRRLQTFLMNNAHFFFLFFHLLRLLVLRLFYFMIIIIRNMLKERRRVRERERKGNVGRQTSKRASINEFKWEIYRVKDGLIITFQCK